MRVVILHPRELEPIPVSANRSRSRCCRSCRRRCDRARSPVVLTIDHRTEPRLSVKYQAVVPPELVRARMEVITAPFTTPGPNR